MKVEIYVSTAELDYIRESIRQKHEILMQYLDDCAEDAAGAENPPFAESYVLNPGRVKAMKDAGVWDDPVARAAVIKKFIEFDRKQVTEQLRKQVDDQFDEQFKKSHAAFKKSSVVKPYKPKKPTTKRTVKAPYGLKKDGTPAKKRGRKAA